MKLSDKISAPLGYARTAIAETISAVWTFTQQLKLGGGAEVTGLIDNTDSGIKHNIASFTISFATGEVIAGELPFQGKPNAWSVQLLEGGTSSTYLAVISAGMPKQLVASLEFIVSDPCKTIQIDNQQNIVPFDANGTRIGNNTTSAEVTVIAVF